MGIEDQSLTSVPKDLARQLGREGIRKLLVLLINAYQDLYHSRWVKADSPEDAITEEWVVRILRRWKPDLAFNLVPIHQKQDASKAKARGRRPTIDFCFRHTFFAESYFGAECKLLDQGCKKHLNAYLDDEDGIGRFISSKYSASTSAGAMVGYVRRGDSSEVAADITSGIKALAGNPSLQKSPTLPGFDPLYESQHQRQTGASPFLCYHLLFAFDC